jgi:hypothetical protein
MHSVCMYARGLSMRTRVNRNYNDRSSGKDLTASIDKIFLDDSIGLDDMYMYVYAEKWAALQTVAQCLSPVSTSKRHGIIQGQKPVTAE